MKKILYLITLITFQLSISQENLGDFKNMTHLEDNKILINTTKGEVHLEFCSDKMLRVRANWGSDFEVNENYMVIQYDWPKVDIKKIENQKEISLKTSQIEVLVQKKPYALAILDLKGKVLSDERVQSTNISGSYKTIDTVGVTKTIFPDEHFFGFGERMDGLDRLAKKTKLNVGRGQGRPHIVGAYNILEANYSPIPFFMSTRGYGIFFHTAYPTNWDMGYSNKNKYDFYAEGGELDYYFIYGPDFPSILDSYTNVTGKAPLLPKFALGLHVGTYSGGTWGHEAETSDAYVVDLVKKFRELEIPIDVLHLDSTWRIFGEHGGKGATSFEWRETFKNPKGMFDSIYAQNINMVGLHLRPRFDNGKTYRLLDKARDLGYVYPEKDGLGDFVNFFDQASIDWWWENGVKKVADQGAMFLKTDEGSAFGHKANESDKTGPQGENIIPLHNLFPIAYAKAPYEKFAEYNKLRGMNQTREGYAGIQRYPYIFAGDWPSEWQYFEPVITAGLNIGMSGVGNWSHCMGGFEHIADPELYIRWCQFGLLSPIAHLFGMEHPNYKEPWNYGEEALGIFKKFDELRYSLIPYLYSSSYQMHLTGKPLMRALVIDNQEDSNTYGITDQYMLGESLMVCPVTTKGAKTRVVYLPKGTWIDYWTGTKYKGKQHISALCPIERIPLFVKAGAILPSQEVTQYIKDEPNTITIDIYPMGKSSFTLYDDDGRTMEYKSIENYATTLIEVNENDNEINLILNKPKGKYELKTQELKIKIHDVQMPKSVLYNNELLPQNKAWMFNENTLEARISFNTNIINKLSIILR